MSQVKSLVQEIIEETLAAAPDGLVRVHEVQQALGKAGFVLEFPIDPLLERFGFKNVEGFVVAE